MRGNGRYWATASALALIGCGAMAGQAQAQARRDDPNVIGELVVTAERRDQNLQTTAISATVLDQQLLEAKGVVGLTSLQYAAPGIQISDYSSANTFNIRGIGQSQVDIDLPSGVVIYRDGVPTLTGYFQNAPYYDIAGVEVLRGPQGTFVGKSAAAGAVFIRTRDPEIGKAGMDVTLGAGNREQLEGTFVLNVPIGETVAIRLATHSEHRGSLFDSITSNPLPGGVNYGGPFTGNDDRDLFSFRAGIRWTPTEAFNAVFKIDYDELDFGSHATSGFVPTTGAEEDLDDLIVNGPHEYKDQGVRSSLNLTYDFAGGFQLKSLTGYSRVKTRADWDVNGSNPAPFGFVSGGKFTNYSQEFDILTPQDRRFRFVGGVFLQRYVNDIPKFPEPGFQFITDNTTTPLLASPWKKNEESYAFFGQGAFDITEQLELQVGVRWGHYEFDQFTQFELFPGALNLPFLQPAGGVAEEFDEDSTDWKVNLNYEVNDDHFVYALVSRGHTPGSINIFPNPTTATTRTHTAYKEMEVINYEGGWKAAFLNRQIRTQLAAYYQTFKNYQAGFAIAAGAGIPSIDNVAEFKNARTRSKIYGVELGAQGNFGDLTFDAGLAYSKSKLGSFGLVTNIFAPVYGGPAAIDLSGTTTPFAPKWTASGGVAYAFHLDTLADGATLTPRVDVSYRSKSYANLFHNRATLLEDVTLVNASIRYESGPWWASLWATNLFDERFAAAKQNVTGAAGTIAGIVYMAPRRLYGLRVGRSF
jgi:iron complex outermembrane recepter protein